MYLFGVFQDAVVAAFESSVTAYSFAPTIATVISGLLSPVVGARLVARGRPGWSIRTAMMTGSVAIGAGLLLISRAGSLPMVTLPFALLVAPGVVFLGPLVTQAMVTNWFDLRRGQALGIVAAGTTVGGAVVPPCAGWLIEVLGWRDAMALLGSAMLLLSLPLVAWLARSTPADVGESHELGPAPSPQHETTVEEAPLSTAEILRLPVFWLVGVMFALQFAAGSLSVIYTVPYASQLGLGLAAGGGILGLRSLFGAMGKVALGRLSDHFPIRRVLLGVFAVEVLLTFLLIQSRDPLLFSILGLGLGFVGAAMLPLKGALVGLLFGRASFASAFGLLQMVATPFNLVMIPLGGWLYDQTGDYAMVFAAMIPLFALAGLLMLFVRPAAAQSAISKVR